MKIRAEVKHFEDGQFYDLSFTYMSRDNLRALLKAIGDTSDDRLMKMAIESIQTSRTITAEDADDLLADLTRRRRCGDCQDQP